MMMLRIFLLVLLAGLGGARASEKIDAPSEGASKSVQQPHVVAELIPEMTTVEAGKPFGMILHLKMDPQWHTYWINPGDAGLATTIKWTLPKGFTAGPILWPTPENHSMGGLVTYGYEGDVYLLTEITPPATGDLPEHLDVAAKASWLVCQEACIPGKAELSVTLDTGIMNFRLPTENKELFKEARARLPVANTRWEVLGWYGDVASRNSLGGPQALNLDFRDKVKPTGKPLKLEFFPEQNNVVDGAKSAPQEVTVGETSTGSAFTLSELLVQNGDKPGKVSGVLVSDQPLIEEAKSVYISEFPVGQKPPGAGEPTGGMVPSGYPEAGMVTMSSDSLTYSGSTTVSSGTMTMSAVQTTGTVMNGLVNAASVASASAIEDATGAGHAPATTDGQEPVPPTLIAVLAAAFIGGLILNLMPCVLPVLSLKVFALIKHAGTHPEKAWKQGVAFAVGVVVSFWVLAGLLLALRAAGNHLGWGFQMQSPGFVVAMMLLFFLLGLNLLGVFEIGGSLVGLDAKAASHAGGSVSSFLNGALATVAATPCTAPFMGSALGFAAQQSTFISMLIFTFLALGMALPYLLLTIFPQTLRFVPKPGAWMESLKQFMGFLLLGTVIYYVYCFVALVGEDQLVSVLSLLLIAAVAAWVYGRWTAPTRSPLVRTLATVKTIFLLGCVGVWSVFIIRAEPVARSATATNGTTIHADGYQDWSQEAVQAALAKGQPVFVDFTAAWCLSCKVNERVALGTDAVKKAFADKNVALFRADWTRSDPVISQTLQKFGRDGVPLYLMYSPKSPDAPQVLPEVLTPGIVLDALGKI
jgi:thiol:disulfide interchange protein/DsbC/DsbD-like thiol-disulfide interchange protein